eukprot:COSAG02_NODE_986_length_15452_cov_17.818602_8_plen_187_part_00
MNDCSASVPDCGRTLASAEGLRFFLHGRADEKNATGADRCSGRERVLVDDGCARESNCSEIHVWDVTGVRVRDSIFPPVWHRIILAPQRILVMMKRIRVRAGAQLWVVVPRCLAIASPRLLRATNRPRSSSTVFWRVLLGRGGIIEAGICNKLWRIDICVGHVAPQTRAIVREPLNFDADHAQRAL